MGEASTRDEQITAVGRADPGLSVEQLKRHVETVQGVMASVMREDEHYGTIPGTKKPSLYKSGAEKLSLTFRLAPTYEIRKTDLPGGHREYEIVCTLTHIPTGEVFGQGVGACSTMEAKYRFRTGEVEFTGRPVPQEYWDNRDKKLLGGPGFGAKKNPDTGKWEIVRQGERVEHDNPADHYNTVLKMAKKRAQIDATLTCTAASDIFTQDVEDLGGAKEAGGNGRSAPPALPDREGTDRRFEELLNREAEHEMVNIEDVAAFVAEVAESSGSTPERVRAQAVQHWKRFWTAYTRARRPHDANGEPPSEDSKVKAGTRGPGKPGEPAGTVSCPDLDGREVPVTKCAGCEAREGCPSHDQEQEGDADAE